MLQQSHRTICNRESYDPVMEIRHDMIDSLKINNSKIDPDLN